MICPANGDKVFENIARLRTQAFRGLNALPDGMESAGANALMAQALSNVMLPHRRFDVSAHGIQWVIAP